jgi:signal transduction histidine kinase
VVDRNAKGLIHLVGDLLVMAQVEGGMLSFDWAEVELTPLIARRIEAAEPAAEQAEVELTPLIARWIEAAEHAAEQAEVSSHSTVRATRRSRATR